MPIRRATIAPALQVLELGAGDGSLMLAVARALLGERPAVELTLLDRQHLLTATTVPDYEAAGSSPSDLLASSGCSLGLVEKQPLPRPKVCGECVAASNLPLLDALDMGADFTAQAGPALRQVVLMRGARTVVADLPPAALPQHLWGRALGRETRDAML